MLQEVDSDWAEDIAPEEEDSAAEDSVSYNVIRCDLDGKCCRWNLWVLSCLTALKYSQTSFIRTSLIWMIRNPNTFSWEQIFLVSFVLVSESRQARF